MKADKYFIIILAALFALILWLSYDTYHGLIRLGMHLVFLMMMYFLLKIDKIYKSPFAFSIVIVLMVVLIIGLPNLIANNITHCMISKNKVQACGVVGEIYNSFLKKTIFIWRIIPRNFN